MFETIRYDVADSIATITLNRPDRLNAFNSTMAREMIAAFDLTDADDAVRVVIVTGEGRGFCAGADLEAGADTFNYEARDGSGPLDADGTIDWSHPDVRDTGGKVTLRIFESLKPVIAAVSVALIRQLLWRGLGLLHPMEAHRIDSRGVYARGRSADAAEGVSSFLEKRPAVYADKVSTGMIRSARS
ncbi:MAG: enoyl-CoA hydratase-related protein [Rhizorhabdus sp.]